MPTITTTTITQADLAELGFTRDQIAHLQTLRDRFDPFQEFCESNQEFERFRFLQWLYQEGLVKA